MKLQDYKTETDALEKTPESQKGHRLLEENT